MHIIISWSFTTLWQYKVACISEIEEILAVGGVKVCEPIIKLLISVNYFIGSYWKKNSKAL